ncbi:MAG: GAF domain-containing protein [Phycisphaerae bacterium]
MRQNDDVQPRPEGDRPYAQIESSVRPERNRVVQMQSVVDLLWAALKDTDVSWVGFYLHEGGDELILGPCRDTPACSPIGLHGVCGRSFRDGKAVIVDDVAKLGDGYIACDPRDRSEVVIPLFEPDGRCWGVLDLDSRRVGAFDQQDLAGLTPVLRAAGLTT